MGEDILRVTPWQAVDSSCGQGVCFLRSQIRPQIDLSKLAGRSRLGCHAALKRS